MAERKRKTMGGTLDFFGGRDIVEVLKFYCEIFPDKAVFRVALDEIKRLRNEEKDWSRRGKARNGSPDKMSS
jgi:hypothetical protein